MELGPWRLLGGLLDREECMSEIRDLKDRLQAHSQLLLDASDALSVDARAARELRNDYDVARAQERLKIKTDPACQGFTVAEKDAVVILACEVLMRETTIAETEVDSLKIRIRAVADSLTAVQSEVRLVKTEADLSKYDT